ncbi:Protein of unknown function (DUF3037) [Chitinophaga niastensis]|uniref:DUF3037 family protein n=1 Tax=Chitinophaga niastensis TaxID=536980 RepID=A0A2P8HP46_CHINA|nr:DUF3037 domain-containing protein [Chitinophaga niastensis]PSL47975.1 Protein of unknown function (DUF3037) [Chitinophaga niastensis]
MQENHLFEYAVIRIVPRVEREEFLNVGVILYCKQQRFLQAVFTLDEERLRTFSPHTDIAEVKAYLDAFVEICHGGKEAGPIGKLDIASRFRWLTATRSSVVQTSKVHPGFCGGDAAETLNRLHRQLVL